MSQLLAILGKINAFADSSLPASWLVHAGGAVLGCLLIGPVCTVVLFAAREAEQWYHTRAHPEPWYDYVMDVAGPLVVAVAWTVMGLPNASAWLQA